MRYFRSVPVQALAAWFALSGCADHCDSWDSPDPHSAYCEEEAECVSPPSDCTDVIPTAAVLNLVFSQPLPEIVRIYRGKAHETGAWVMSVIPSSTAFSVYMPLGDYSVTALYVRGTDTVLAVDGGEVGYEQLDTCTKTCYAGIGIELNLALE